MQSVLDDPVLVLLLGLGTTAGVVAMALVLVPAVRPCRWRLPLALGAAPPGGPQARTPLRWTVGYVAANQVAFFVVLVLAYRSKADVSVYIAAFTFFQLPHGLLAVSIMTALAPELARAIRPHDFDGAARPVRHRAADAPARMIPAAIGMARAGAPARCARCSTTATSPRASVAVTADTLRAFAIGLVAFSVYLYVMRTYTSMQNTRTPFVLNVVENGVNVATAFAL